MTVVSSGNTITFAGDGVQTFFDFNFRIFKAEDLCAVLRNSEGKEERLVLGSDFKIISGVGSDSGGRVQHPISGEPLSTGQRITLYREIVYTQELELVDNDPFSAQLLNEAFDRGVMRDQQLQEQVDRALKYDISTPVEERLTPHEMVQTISNARDEAVSARSGAIDAEGNARGMLVDAQAAQTSSEAACDKALLAQSAAEEARDSAIKIAVGDLSPLRSSTPILSAPAEAPEGTTVSIVITDHSEDGVTSYEINTFGFGSASISGNTISWVLEPTFIDVTKSLDVIRRRRGEFYSETAKHQLLVKHISVQDGSTMVFADSIVGYPGATVDADGVHIPAYSVAADNINQIVSATAEIVQISGKLALLDGTSASVLKVNENYTGSVVTDQGEAKISSIVDAGSGEYSATLVQALPGVPTKAIKKSDVAIKVGAGVEGEYLGQEKKLQQKRTGGGANLIPEMTGETTNGCTITSNLTPVESAPAGPVWYVGRRSVDSAVRWTESGLCELTIAYGSTQTAAGYSFQAWDSTSTGADLNPKEWEVFVRRSGNDWVKVDSRLLTSSWTYGEKRSFDFSEMQTFDELKFNFIRSFRSVTDRMFGTIEVLDAGSVTSTTTSIEIVSNDSIKDQILMAGGLHKHLLVDGQLVEIESVSEVDNGDGTYTATIILKTVLASAPTAETVVAIPNRCTLPPASYTCSIDGDDLKITGKEIALEDNPALKRLAMAVSGDVVTFKSGKIYIKEKP